MYGACTPRYLEEMHKYFPPLPSPFLNHALLCNHIQSSIRELRHKEFSIRRPLGRRPLHQRRGRQLGVPSASSTRRLLAVVTATACAYKPPSCIAAALAGLLTIILGLVEFTNLDAQNEENIARANLFDDPDTCTGLKSSYVCITLNADGEDETLNISIDPQGPGLPTESEPACGA